MKYSNDQRKYVRKLGQPRKNFDIYHNLGHPFDIKNKEAIFIGAQEKTYSLTTGKKYIIIKADTINKSQMFDRKISDMQYDYDKSRRARRMKTRSRFESFQGEDYFITIINDLGHKRQYAHNMFRMPAQEVTK